MSDVPGREEAQREEALEGVLAMVDDAFEHSAGPVPGHLLDAARAAFRWRRADAELAALLFDSATDELVGVRGTTTDRRSFRFGAGETVVRVHLTAATLTVMIEPPLPVGCRVASAHGAGPTEEHRTDDDGELTIDAPELPVRLELDLPGGRVVTPWIIG